MGGVHDPGSRVAASISIIPHHPLLPVRAQRGPHRSACGPHHHDTADCPCVALRQLCGLLHPSAEPADSHDERHPLEGGAGARWALEDSGIRRGPQEDTGHLLFRNVWALITQLLLPVTGCCYNVNAGKEAASLPVASSRSVRPWVRSEGTLVSQVRQWLENMWGKTREGCALPYIITTSRFLPSVMVSAIVIPSPVHGSVPDKCTAWWWIISQWQWTFLMYHLETVTTQTKPEAET